MFKIFIKFLFVGLLINFIGQYNLFWFLFLLLLCFVEGVFVKMFFYQTKENKTKSIGSKRVVLLMAFVIFWVHHQAISIVYKEPGFYILYIIIFILGLVLYSETRLYEDDKKN
jgi:uncharacterized membrane protein YoaK (UPF0700 family)